MRINGLDVDPIEELSRNVNLLIWASAIFAVIISIIAVSGLSIAWWNVHKQVDQNRELIIAVCRQQNALKNDIVTIALDLGVPRYKLAALIPLPCTKTQLQRDFGKS